MHSKCFNTDIPDTKSRNSLIPEEIILTKAPYAVFRVLVIVGQHVQPVLKTKVKYNSDFFPHEPLYNSVAGNFSSQFIYFFVLVSRMCKSGTCV